MTRINREMVQIFFFQFLSALIFMLHSSDRVFVFHNCDGNAYENLAHQLFDEMALRKSLSLGTSAALSAKMQSNEGQEFQIRKLEISDKSKGFIQLLQQLTVCDSVSDKEYEDRFGELSSLGDDHVICVIEDDRSGKIIATGTVFIEKKFLRNCGKVGHIEDIVVDANARGMQLGKKIINFLMDHAHSMGCYKVILDCSIENRAFYEKCGFKQKEIQMVKYFI